MKKIYFPRLIIPLSSVLVTLFDFLMALSIYIVLLIYYQIPVAVLYFTLSLISAVLITSLATFGIGSMLAALNIKYRDFKYVTPYMVQVLLFATPVIYPASIINDGLVKTIVYLNPVSGSISLLRSAISDSPVEWPLVTISVVSALVCFITGILYFRKSENYFADIA